MSIYKKKSDEEEGGGCGLGDTEGKKILKPTQSPPKIPKHHYTVGNWLPPIEFGLFQVLKTHSTKALEKFIRKLDPGHTHTHTRDPHDHTYVCCASPPPSPPSQLPNQNQRIMFNAYKHPHNIFNRIPPLFRQLATKTP